MACYQCDLPGVIPELRGARGVIKLSGVIPRSQSHLRVWEGELNCLNDVWVHSGGRVGDQGSVGRGSEAVSKGQNISSGVNKGQQKLARGISWKSIISKMVSILIML